MSNIITWPVVRRPEPKPPKLDEFTADALARFRADIDREVGEMSQRLYYLVGPEIAANLLIQAGYKLKHDKGQQT